MQYSVNKSSYLIFFNRIFLWGNYASEYCEGIETGKLLPESCMKMDENFVNKGKKRVCAKSRY
jgi:hypothetical protein